MFNSDEDYVESAEDLLLYLSTLKGRHAEDDRLKFAISRLKAVYLLGVEHERTRCQYALYKNLLGEN